MTISSHPWLKLLVAIIAAIAVGIILSSWGWGIATFFILMFIFIWVASWIFGGVTGSRPVRPTKLNRPSLPGKFQKNQGVICQDNLNTR